jgi:hypothetical protein
LKIRKRGVKVELGIPEDLWDEPSAEITQLKKYVSLILYFNKQIKIEIF